ncbi:MAG: hypothetical protein OQL19_02700 [Gammaproteobacteria bacterium]|nr:hypothetical protein [Gammaproteobacteria bacterium]
MGFVIGAVVALIVIFLLAYITVKKPVFGEVMIGLSILMVLTSTFFYFQKDNRVEDKKSRIPPEKIILSDISHSLAYGYYYKLKAQLTNQSSKYRLQSINLNIKFYQCPQTFNALIETNYDQCKFLMEKPHSIKTRLSPKQSTDIESYVLLDEQVLINAYASLKSDGSLSAEGSLSANGSSSANGSIQWQTIVVDGLAR